MPSRAADMAKGLRRVALLAALAAVTALLSGTGTSSGAFAATTAPGAAASYLSRLLVVVAPGAAVAYGASLLYARWQSPPKPAWCLCAALFLMLTLSVPYAAPGELQQPQQQQQQAKPRPLAPRSGEERLMEDGTFVRVADPRPGNGPIEEGWQQALWTEMAQAIQSGSEQVVMVFSRQGCPWCDRLHPVLQNAIKRRAASIADGSAAGGPPLLNAPLRVFVYDAQEFGPIMQRFQIQGFPTIMAFGPPGSRPAMVPGYLGDDDFDRLLYDTATAALEEEKPSKKSGKKKGLFGLR
eukprot:TRINITY_DN9436_c0_g2_i1.p1 TRINITY_DN9436_c0_g2~~TRINITY_DN9436_c0_g2_i1.p1  ORF type:complete len:296 (-),score=64.11 TRINITY_DN9436_c0_g2_i1:22-909(-)